jgi:hypothetical protein
MRETEVIAIEVKQYVDADGTRQTIVPSVVGRTEAARAAKGPSPRSANRAVDFSNPPPGFNELLTRMDAVAAERGLTVRFVSTGRNYQPAITEAGAKHTSGVGVYSTSRQTELNLAIFRELGADAVADELLDRVRRVTGLNVTARAWPAFPCEAVVNDWERARRELIEP